MIILDTNVISEALKPAPSSRVMSWLEVQPKDDVYTTAICEAEVLRGVELLPQGKRRQNLSVAIASLFRRLFADRILSFDSAAAHAYASISAARQKAGRHVAEMDIQVAAIAVIRGAAVATRNTDDFTHCGIGIINPWDA